MTGFAAKKVGDRTSQASSAANQSIRGSLGSRTKASSDRARKFCAWAGVACAFIRWSVAGFVNHLGGRLVYEMLRGGPPASSAAGKIRRRCDHPVAEVSF